MSKILAEQLLAGIILGDNDNQEYIYLPGGEVGRQDLPLDKAVEQAKRLHLKPVAHPEMGRRSY